MTTGVVVEVGGIQGHTRSDARAAGIWSWEENDQGTAVLAGAGDTVIWGPECIEQHKSWLDKLYDSEPSQTAWDGGVAWAWYWQIKNLTVEGVKGIMDYLQGQGAQVINCAVKSLKTLYPASAWNDSSYRDLGWYTNR